MASPPPAQPQLGRRLRSVRDALGFTATASAAAARSRDAQQEEHTKLLADTKAAHEAVVEGHKQHLSKREMAALEAKEEHEKELLAVNEQWRLMLEAEAQRPEEPEEYRDPSALLPVEEALSIYLKRLIQRGLVEESLIRDQCGIA